MQPVLPSDPLLQQLDFRVSGSCWWKRTAGKTWACPWNLLPWLCGTCWKPFRYLPCLSVQKIRKCAGLFPPPGGPPQALLLEPLDPFSYNLMARAHLILTDSGIRRKLLLWGRFWSCAALQNVLKLSRRGLPCWPAPGGKNCRSGFTPFKGAFGLRGHGPRRPPKGRPGLRRICQAILYYFGKRPIPPEGFCAGFREPESRTGIGMILNIKDLNISLINWSVQIENFGKLSCSPLCCSPWYSPWVKHGTSTGWNPATAKRDPRGMQGASGTGLPSGAGCFTMTDALQALRESGVGVCFSRSSRWTIWPGRVDCKF